MSERYAKLPAAAVFDPRLSAEAVRVLAALCTYTDKQNLCYPAVDTIADRLGLGRRQAQRHLKAIRAAGYIVPQGSRRAASGNLVRVYRVAYPTSETPAADAVPEPTIEVENAPDQTPIEASSDDVFEPVNEPLKTSPDDAFKTSPDDVSEPEKASSDDVLPLPEPGPKRHRMTSKASSDDVFGVSSDDTQTNPLNYPNRTNPERGARGSRLPPDAILHPDWRKWAQQARPDLDPDQVFDGFKDYWLAKPGKDGTKADWSATWRNWIRKERSHGNQHRQNRPGEHRAAAALSAAAELAREAD